MGVVVLAQFSPRIDVCGGGREQEVALLPRNRETNLTNAAMVVQKRTTIAQTKEFPLLPPRNKNAENTFLFSQFSIYLRLLLDSPIGARSIQCLPHAQPNPHLNFPPLKYRRERIRGLSKTGGGFLLLFPPTSLHLHPSG